MTGTIFIFVGVFMAALGGFIAGFGTGVKAAIRHRAFGVTPATKDDA